MLHSTLPVEFLEYEVYEESGFRFQGISVSAFCLLCLHRPGLSLVPQDFYVSLFINILIWWYFVITGNGENYHDVIIAVCCSKHASSQMSLLAPLLHFQHAIYILQFDFASPLHHRFQTDYNFQIVGRDFLRIPSAPPTLNDCLSLRLDCENKKKNYLGRLVFIAQYLHRPLMWYRNHINPVYLLQLVPGTMPACN